MRKILLTAVAVLAMVGPTMADGVTSTTNSDSSSGAQSSSGIVMNSGKSTGLASAPGLIASGLSCSGSASIGGAGAGWGLSFGITKEDRACNAREDAKYIHGVTGDMSAAKERLCQMPENRAAFLRAGHPCAADTARVSRVATVKSFKNMAACRRYAAKHSGVRCRSQ